MSEFTCRYLDNGSVAVIRDGVETHVGFSWQLLQDLRLVHTGMDIEAEVTRAVCQELNITSDEDKLALITALIPVFNNTLEKQANG